MALTSGERSALWRKRQRNDTEKHEKYKQKERERYLKRKERGNIKLVHDMSEREKRSKRRAWKISSKTYRDRTKKITAALKLTMTPPNSPPDNGPGPSREIQNRDRGRRKKNLNRSKAYREQFKLRIALNKERRMKDMYKKRYYRLKNKNIKRTESQIDNEVEIIMNDRAKTKTAITMYSILINNIRKRYSNAETAEKRMLKKLIYREAVLRKYGIGDFAKKATGISESRIRVHANTPRRQRSTVFQKNITDFFERDDNSRIKAGKKSTITRRKVKKQIRLMNDSLTNLHKKFLYENSSNISFSLFARLKPFWIKRATEKDRETCLCKIHENPILKLNKLASEGVFEHRDLNTLIQDITCDTNSMSCMYRTCTECKDKAFKTNVVKSNINTGKIIEWKMWKNKRIEREITLNGEKQVKKSNMTLKSQESGTIETLIYELHEEISRLARHEFNIKHQYIRLHQLKQNLTDNEVIIHIDFSENYQCKYASEIQSVHFGSSKRQISIHTGVAYFKSKHISFATVSDDLKHSPPGIWAHLDPILLHIRRTTPDIDKIHFVSDGPTTQYRCKSNFYLFSTKIFEYGFVNGGSWNFMEAGHGKGAPDGIGAVVKREADTLVNTHETDITGASALMRGLEKLGSRLMIFEVKNDDITQQEAAIPTKITGVPETMKLHQVVVKESGTVQSRILSCFCSPDCSCYQPVTTNFNVQPFANPAPLDDDSIVGPQNGADLPCQILNVPVSIDESLVDSYCLVEYDNKPYPGKITEVDDIGVKVSAMHCVGINRYFWPLHKDECWYEKDRIITMLPCEPEKLSGRHQALPLPIWEAVKDKYDL